MNLPPITLTLFGGVTIARGGTAVTGFASRKAEALLIYLACNPLTHPRESLATLLWPNNDQSRALANLSVALSSIRKLLPDATVAERHAVSINTNATIKVDATAFQTSLEEVKTVQKQRGRLGRSDAALLATAVERYKGEFLEGFHIRNSIPFEDWMLLEQERLRYLYLDALADLVDFYQQRHQYGSAIDYAQTLLATDPLQERIHRQLMMLYTQDNQRHAALMQYEQCGRVLEEELGVEPDEETKALFKEILGGGNEGAAPDNNSAVRHNLSTASTLFVGREAEMGRIDAWLAQPRDRLLTISGPGGSGKTRLAQEAALRAVGHFADGVRYVSLVSQTEASSVFAAIAESVGLTFSGTDEPAHQLLAHLPSQEMLLILDNLEHLLGPELLDFISALMTSAPDLFLIVTSRERLRLQAETVLDLSGLPYPDETGPPSNPFKPESPLSEYPAVALFVDRATRIQPTFALAGQEIAVTRLCRLVGGLPLGLELSATWTRILSIADIINEIERGLGRLTTTLLDVPERHRSLHAVIESSWQLLSPEEQTLFRRLAVFRGGITRKAAEQVAGAELPPLLRLVDRSFLRLDEDHRFRRHPLLFQFAQEQLALQPDELSESAKRHARYFASFLQGREPTLDGSGAPQVLEEIGADLDNVRAAWRWGMANKEAALLARMVSGIGRFFSDRSRYLEAHKIFSESLATVQRWQKSDARQQLAAKIGAELGFFLYQNGRYHEAQQILLDAYEIAKQFDLTRTQIVCLKHLGDVTADQGIRDESRTYLRTALQLCREAGGYEHLQLPVLNALGNREVTDGNYETAQAYFAEAMQLARAANHTLRLAILHNNMAIVANRLEQFDEAIRQYQLAHDGFAQNDHAWGMAATTHNIGMVYAELKEYERALTYIQDAYAAHEEIGHRRGMVGGLSVLGTIYRKMGKRRQARRYFNDSLRLAQEVGVTWAALSTLVDVAELEMSYSHLKEAALLLAFAIDHPAIEATTLDNARRLLEELRAELPDETVKAVETAAQSHTLESIVNWLVNS